MTPGLILARALVGYVALHILMRLAGKRALAEAGTQEVILAVLIADMFGDMLWGEAPIAAFLIATGVVVLMQVVVTWTTSRNERLETILNGRPVLVLSQGRALRDGLRAERLSERDLAALLRHHGVDRSEWDGVEQAWLEPSGRLSVRWTDAARPRRRADPS